MIPNYPVTKADILCADDIFRVKIGSPQGETCKKTVRVITTLHELPTEIIERHGNVTLEADIMYVNKIPFFVTTSQAINSVLLN